MLLPGKYGSKMYSTSSQGQYGQYTKPLAVYELGKIYSSMIISFYTVADINQLEEQEMREKTNRVATKQQTISRHLFKAEPSEPSRLDRPKYPRIKKGTYCILISYQNRNDRLYYRNGIKQ